MVISNGRIRKRGKEIKSKLPKEWLESKEDICKDDMDIAECKRHHKIRSLRLNHRDTDAMKWSASLWIILKQLNCLIKNYGKK